ncbi:MAG: tetratricopeptide repeat protein [Pyrinomonadaceae bacterium]|nr:tetratricopeptide repeat protein [Pyrinomonadaceae bacterium]
MSAPFVYGKVTVKGVPPGGKEPRVSVTYNHTGQTPKRLVIGKTGNYCFKISSGIGGTLILDVDGVELARKQVANFGTAQQREDFEIDVSKLTTASKAGVVSSKYYRPPNAKTADLYTKAADAEKAKDRVAALAALNQIVVIDPADHVAWGLIGSVNLEDKKLAEAEAAFRKALGSKVDYTPVWVNMGRLRMAQKQYEAAIEILKHASSLEPESAEIYLLLGESYLQTKQGSLGADALNQAIKLDPQGMAEAHLQLAHLYQLAKANKMAADEYKKFLEKRPDHPDKKKYEKFIKENQ